MDTKVPAVVVVGGAGLVGRYVLKRWKQKMEAPAGLMPLDDSASQGCMDSVYFWMGFYMGGCQNYGSPLSPLASHYEINDWVWHKDDREGYRRSRVLSVDNFRDAQNASRETGLRLSYAAPVRKSDVRPFYDVGEDWSCALLQERTFQDCTEMVHLDDANILDNLRKRYSKDEIYTYTANVLLAVNPYKSEMEKYWGKNPGTLPPHPYAIADVAYRRMQRNRKNQALVISGESGAGKTETAKITMHYLTSMTDVEHGNKIQEKIVKANPILESFGNASTVMNMNSSRFGKYNEMMFDRVGSLVGAGIKTFLLESSRVVFQQHGEKNYHVFYELLAGMDEEYLDKLMLDREESYKLLHSSGTLPLREGSPETQRLAKQFEELKYALSLFINEEEQDPLGLAMIGSEMQTLH
eukprot:s216_g6.t1